jgi:hypothetical protein
MPRQNIQALFGPQHDAGDVLLRVERVVGAQKYLPDRPPIGGRQPRVPGRMGVQITQPPNAGLLDAQLAEEFRFKFVVTSAASLIAQRVLARWSDVRDDIVLSLNHPEKGDGKLTLELA